MQRELKIKVCGMRDRENILTISAFQPDYLGFIFYPGSKRFVSPEQMLEIASIKMRSEKVGVFVNEKDEHMEAIAAFMGIRILQLHGDESPEQCDRLRMKGFIVIKAFRLPGRADSVNMNLEKLGAYSGSCDYFLFDTGGKAFGGSGKKFNWGTLGDYNLSLPFFLSGGVGPADHKAIKALDHPQLYAVDVNSRFETVPGIKDAELLRSFTDKIRS